MKTVLMQPFFASFIMNRSVSEGSTPVGTAHTDGKNIVFDPKFVASNSPEHLSGVLVHEVLHIVNFHLSRAGGRDQMIWNMACDYAINPIVKANGFKLPDGHLDHEDFHGMSAEEIYDKLKQNPGGYGTGSDDFVDFGAFSIIDMTDQDKEQLVSEIIQAATSAKMQGRTPAGMDRIFEELLTPQVNWREALTNFLKNSVGRDDYSYRRPNRAYPDMCLPTVGASVGGRILFGIDTSGSIDNHALKVFITEVDDIKRQFRADITLAWCDSMAYIQEFSSDEEIEYKPKGGGGTSFVPVFDYAEGHDCIIYFTDGFCDDFPEPHENTLWATTLKSFKPPFGEVIIING